MNCPCLHVTTIAHSCPAAKGTTDGEASPVPVGSFRSFEDAVVFAEQLAEDQTLAEFPLLPCELLN